MYCFLIRRFTHFDLIAHCCPSLLSQRTVENVLDEMERAWETGEGNEVKNESLFYSEADTSSQDDSMVE